MRRRLLAMVTAVCTLAASVSFSLPAVAAARHVVLPPTSGRFSYQLGGAYRPASGVTVVDRDRTSHPAPGIYSICYVNGFQAQQEDVRWWTKRHPGLLLRDHRGRLVVDQGWGEPLLDVGTAADRSALARIEGRWLAGCAKKGFRAVEVDNLDSYTRSHHLLTVGDAFAFARLLISRAHADGLAIAQKNAAELSPRGRRAGFDFAVAEECQVYSECQYYLHSYGRHVIEIEYTDESVRYFRQACAARGRTILVTRRDRDLLPAGTRGHVEQWCPGTD